MQAEYVEGSAPSSADTWTDIGTFTVPAGVKSVKKIIVGIAPDVSITGGTSASVRAAPVFRLIGSGLLEQSPHEYVVKGGQYVYYSVATNYGSALFNYNNLYEEYDVDIPVQTGGTILAQANLLDEAGAGGACVIGLVYSEEPAGANNSMSQYVDAAVPTSADTFTSVGTITVPQLEKSPKAIKEVSIAIAPDVGTSAVSLRCLPIIRMTGSGIKEGGRHDLIGPTGHVQFVAVGGTGVASGGDAIQLGRRTKVNIPVNPGGQILVECYLADEVLTAGTVAVGVLYE